jgi:glycosyltransferase involved in cell wall biosynthesis
MRHDNPDRLRVLLVMTAREVGGAERYALWLTQALAHACCFTVAVADHPALADLRRQLAATATVLSFPFDRPAALPGIVRQLRRLAREHDLVHLNSNHPASRLGILLGLTLPGAGRPTLSLEQRATPVADVVVPQALAPVLPLLFRLSRRRFAAVVAVSQENRRTLVGYYGLPAAQVVVIPNGIDPAQLTAPTSPEADAAALRRTFGLPSACRVVITVGRLAVNKGQHHLVAAAPAVLARFPAVHFLLVGEGEARPGLAAQVAALGLEGHVTLAGHRNDVPALLRGSDVFVLPSLAEGFALALLEALAAGLPVVATRVGGAEEVIVPGENGFLVPPGDPDALAAALMAALALSPTEVAAMREAARRMAARFDLTHTAAQTLALYRRLSSHDPGVTLSPS